MRSTTARKMMGLPDYNAWEIVKRTNACLMEDPYWLRFSEDETFEDTTRGRARKIMKENQKAADAIAVCTFNAQAISANCISQYAVFDRHYF